MPASRPSTRSCPTAASAPATPRGTCPPGSDDPPRDHRWSLMKHPATRRPTWGDHDETVWGVSDDFKRVESHVCPMSTCTAPAGSPCRTGKGKVAIQYHTARFRPSRSTTGGFWAQLGATPLTVG
ncbi:hypothetical protein [Streptomyces avermitilis]|uniref:hypothetical protein n=1 Tax=Streptomyces avermitilis TaxID=33903 RepID=UPI003F540348